MHVFEYPLKKHIHSASKYHFKSIASTLLLKMKWGRFTVKKGNVDVSKPFTFNLFFSQSMQLNIASNPQNNDHLLSKNHSLANCSILSMATHLF